MAIKVGIVGYGFSTKCFHLPYILPNPDLEVYAFLQRAAPPVDASQMPRWGHCTIDFPKAKHYMTADEFFADESIELVIVCTHIHEEFIEKALLAGKHVAVEKPFVTSSAEADRLIALAKEKGKILTVFHNRRFDSDFLTLEHLVKQGALGDVLEAEIHFDYPSPNWIAGWTGKEYHAGEGMLFALGTHTIDQALHLFGRPASVTAFLRSNRGVDSEVDDTFTVILQYSGEQKNLLVTIKTAIVTHMKDQLRFFVRGSRGTYLKFGTCPQESQAIAAPGKPATSPDYGLEPERIWGTLTTTTEFDPACQKFDEASRTYIGKYPSTRGWYRGYYENLSAALLGKEEVYVKPDTARDGLRIIELARESHEQGRTVAWS
ncbi:NAD(P)-binding protein [Canariomyces notabilis]|uniref:NAD(P)-binding protein n=1 Tax=Canariomyces notabilis TaxID=2074819 RepID=A0AAN6TLX4_9PEZI|nr:NAD(P)-binding protein [Canariomyces arenarius]